MWLALVILAAAAWTGGGKCVAAARACCTASSSSAYSGSSAPYGGADGRNYEYTDEYFGRAKPPRSNKPLPPSPPEPPEPSAGALAQLVDWLGLRTYGGSEQLQASLRELPGLRHLWLTDVDDDSAYAIADALQPGRARRLEMLRLGKDLYADGCAAIAEALGGGGAPVLQALHLSNNLLGDDGTSALADFLLRQGGAPRLRDLQLNHCNVSDEGAAALADALRDGAAPQLQNLWLGGNLIGDYGAEALASAITPGVGEALGLKRLGLYSNAIGDAGALALARALEQRHDHRQRLRANRSAYDLEDGDSGDRDLAVLTVMLFGHQVQDEATMTMIMRTDEMGAQMGGDRLELFSPREEAYALSANASRVSSLAPSLNPSHNPSRNPSREPSRHPSAPSSPNRSRHATPPRHRGDDFDGVGGRCWASPVSNAGWDGGYEYLQEQQSASGGDGARGWDGGYEYLPSGGSPYAHPPSSAPSSRERAGDPSFTRFGEMY